MFWYLINYSSIFFLKKTINELIKDCTGFEVVKLNESSLKNKTLLSLSLDNDLFSNNKVYLIESDNLFNNQKDIEKSIPFFKENNSRNDIIIFFVKEKNIDLKKLPNEIKNKLHFYIEENTVSSLNSSIKEMLDLNHLVLNQTVINELKIKTENNKDLLYAEIIKQGLLDDNDGRLRFISDYTTYKIFDFLVYLFNKNYVDIFNFLSKNREQTAILVSMLVTLLQNYYLFLLLRSKGYDENDIVCTLKLQPFLVTKMKKLLSKFTLISIINKIRDLIDLEKMFKSTSINQELLFLHWIISFNS
ncbi:DNA polymerase III subunit delta [Ureaplasma canigenitalium]|uniref:DNA polymerase III subunit delta n=1 Tax=Ureaplasma canigenitalium TaxID=42092 RepID=UPI0004E0CFAB|nr:hypothetical protein [Ureaplasma canigenitalium]